MPQRSRLAFRSTAGLAAAVLSLLALAFGPPRMEAAPGDVSNDGVWTELETTSMPASLDSGDPDAFLTVR